jgi:hypothetical protein
LEYAEVEKANGTPRPEKGKGEVTDSDHVDFADPDLSPSRLPALGTLAGWLALSIVSVVMVTVWWRRLWFGH